jgi:hypothetical protein
MRDKNSKYGVRPDEVLSTVQEIWKRSEILELCGVMGWNDLAAKIKALPITAKRTFTEKIKHGDVQIVLYRRTNVTTFDAAHTCPFHFTIEDCK